MGPTFIFLGALIFCAHLFAAFFRRSRVPDVLFLVLIGIVLGPVLGWVTPDMLGGVGSLFASVTLVFILIDSGIEMSIGNLRRYWVGIVQVTFYSFCLSMAAAALTAHFLAGLEWLPSLLLGSMVAGTGSSIVIPIIKPIIRVSVIFAVTGSLKAYDLVYILTGGGPQKLTEVPSTLLQEQLFLANKYGMGSAISVMLIVLCFAFALLINKLFKEEA